MTPKRQLFLLLAILATTAFAQPSRDEKVVVITGARFAYPLLERWIERYHAIAPDVQIIIDPRGTADPLRYDILAEAYHEDSLKNTCAILHVGRYAILPVASAGSAFARIYSEKGLTKDAIIEIFFHDIFAQNERRRPIREVYTPYTRLQKAGAPSVFSAYFRREQKDIKGRRVAGADAHLIKALLRDSTGVSYLPLPLVYDPGTRRPVPGIVALPVDLNDNGKVTDEEKIYADLDSAILHLESVTPNSLKNIPTGPFHLSLDRKNASAEALRFLTWVADEGAKDLHSFGFFETSVPDNRDFRDFVAGTAIKH